MAYVSPELHTKPEAAAHAAQAAGVATTISSPCLLDGDAAASTRSGAVPRSKDDGNDTSSAAIVDETESEEVALQGTATVGDKMHDPAVGGDSVVDDQHLHAVHPAGDDGEQQHPPRHTPLAQS